MSERNPNSQNYCYSNRQAHLQKTHQAFQRLATSFVKIQNQLRKVSSNLLRACPENSDLELRKHKKVFKYFNSKVNQSHSRYYGISVVTFPFNTPPYPPNSRSRSPSSRGLTSDSFSKSSNQSESPSLLNDDYTTGSPREHTIK